ncbi:MAG: hypothetical protein OHK0056_21320 [Bacteriovoracaceae bacterium]
MDFEFFFALISHPCFADQLDFKVEKFKGKVTFQNSKINSGDIIKQSGVIETGKGSFVKLSFGEGSGSLTLGPSSSLDLKSVVLDPSSSSLAVTLKNGVIRWVGKHKELGRLKGILTPQAALGVRGTDFVLKTTELFDESEIVVLDGLVSFENLANPNDKASVKKGQWGGVGGRFGQINGKILDLPKKILDHFDRTLKL